MNNSPVFLPESDPQSRAESHTLLSLLWRSLVWATFFFALMFLVLGEKLIAWLVLNLG